MPPCSNIFWCTFFFTCKHIDSNGFLHFHSNNLHLRKGLELVSGETQGSQEILMLQHVEVLTSRSVTICSIQIRKMHSFWLSKWKRQYVPNRWIIYRTYFQARTSGDKINKLSGKWRFHIAIYYGELQACLVDFNLNPIKRKEKALK